MRVRIAQLAILAALLLGAGQLVVAAESSAQAAPAPVRQKKIFAHYMGCYPVAAAATAYIRNDCAHMIRHDGKGKFDAIGDRWRNWPLVPDGLNLTLEQSADLEIRRAMRGGIDGFAMDVWAGGQGAKDMLEALFKVAEEKDYPFELTICLDDAAPGNIRYLMEKHGKSPKLARRDGKPLIFGYNSVFFSIRQAVDTMRERGEPTTGESWKSPALRQTPAGWQRLAEGYRDGLAEAGVPVFGHFCLNGFWYGSGNPASVDGEDPLIPAALAIAKHAGAVGAFLGGGPLYDKMAKGVRAAGAEWSEPMYFQYENINWGGNQISQGSSILRDRWQHARDNESTLIQFVTWNDYTENTCLAPAYETRYAILDLNAYFIQWWKTGKQPVPERDKVYLLYRKYPQDVKIFPFNRRQPDAGGVLEVLTILTQPAQVRLPGRDAQYDAPAGLSWKQFPLTPGPVSAELLRDGKSVLKLESPEPITDRPYREQNSLTCVSSECLRHWKADFGDAPPVWRGEYADNDHDGLPNWFEMYWFGKFFTWSTAGAADPKADPDGDGRDNLREYLDQTDPTKPDAPIVQWTGAGAPDRKWNVAANWSVALDNPSVVPVIFNNADTNAAAPKILDADRAIGGLHVVQNSGTHLLDLGGNTLKIAGDLCVRSGRSGAATLVVSNGTLAVTGSIHCERGPWDEAAWLRFTKGAVLRGPFKGLYVGTEGDGGNQSYACMDMRGAAFADGMLESDTLQIGGSSARGELYLDPDSLKTIKVQKLYISSADTPDMARGGALIGAPVPALGNAWYLPPDVSIHVGSEKARGRLHVHHITSAWGGNRLSRLATQSGGDFEAWLDDLIVSATQGQHEAGSEGWLDLRGMKSFRLDAKDARLGTVEGKGTVRSRAYVFFPAGTARVDRLYIGDSVNTESIAQLHLSNTLLKIDELLDMKKSADISVGVSGRSCGLDLSDKLRIVRTDTPRITITFQQPPAAGETPYWGLRQQGNHAAALDAMVRDGTLVLQKGEFPGADGYKDRVYYDPASGFTYAALVRADEAPAAAETEK